MFPHFSDLCFVLPSEVDPSWGINYTAYTDGLAADVFVRDGFTGQPYVSQVWPGPTLMPDWFHPNTEGYWTDSIRTFWQKVRPLTRRAFLAGDRVMKGWSMSNLMSEYFEVSSCARCTHHSK